MSKLQTKKLVTKEKVEMYYLNGKLHNDEGPAIKYPKELGIKPSYYLYGQEMKEKDWKKALKNREGIPFIKTAAGKAGMRL